MGTNSLSSIMVDEKNTQFKAVNGVLYTKDGTTLVACPGGIETLVVAAQTQIIKSQAFNHSGNLTTVILPEGVSTIGKHAFSRCMKLKNISIPISMRAIHFCAFEECGGITNVCYPGTDSQWTQMDIGESNDDLFKARPQMTINGIAEYTNGTSVANAKIQIFNSDSSLIRSVYSNQMGEYRFTNLGVGTYTISAQDTSGNTASTTISVKRAGLFDAYLTGEPNLKLKASFAVTGVISPASTYSVDLIDKNGMVIQTVSSESNGEFAFEGIPNGTYTLKAKNSTHQAVSEVTVFNKSIRYC